MPVKGSAVAREWGTSQDDGRNGYRVSPLTGRGSYTGAGQPVPRSARLASIRQQPRQEAPRQEPPPQPRRRERSPQPEASRPHPRRRAHVAVGDAGWTSHAPEGRGRKPGGGRPDGAGRVGRTGQGAAGARPAAPRRAADVALRIAGAVVAVVLAIASAIGGLFGRLFGGWRNDAVFSRSGHRGHRHGTGYALRSGYGTGRRVHGYGRQPAVRPGVVLRTAAMGAVALTLLSSIFFVDGVGVGTAAEASLLDMPVKDAGQVPVSTPREEWAAGSLPYLYQTDPAWSSTAYAGGTVARNGCGPTCLTMIYIYLTGSTDMTPADMCALADAHGFAPTGATEHAFMTDGAALLGITGAAINPQQASEVESALRAGEPVVCAVRPGDFTPNGHFIILYGIDDAGMASVHDPNSSYRSTQKWDLRRVLNQTAMCWTFSL